MLTAAATQRRLWTPSGGLLAGGMGTPAPPDSAWEFVNLGTWDICAYLNPTNIATYTGHAPGDHAYEIPDGDYYVSRDLNDGNFPPTAGIYKGHALFRPQTFRGAHVSLAYPGKVLPNGQHANGDLRIQGQYVGGTTRNIVLCGMKFQDGVIDFACDNVHWWYPEITFPYTSWFAEPNYSSGTSYHGTNDCMFWEYGAVNSRMFGAYIHDVGSGPTFHNGCRSIYMIGYLIETVDNGGRYDRIHPDAIPYLGGNIWTSFHEDFEIRAIGRGLGIQNQNLSGNFPGGPWTSADSSNNNFKRGWVHDCAGAGIQVNSFKKMDGTPTHNDGTWEDIHSWNNGTGAGGQSQASYQYIEATEAGQLTYTLGQNPQPDRVSYPATGTCDTLIPQSGSSPPQLWQQAHPYSSVIDFFTALGWPQ